MKVAKTYNSDCTVLVASCDKYADLLRPFSALWEKFWQDCPFETVLVTETAPATRLQFDRVITCGAGLNWSSRLVQALDCFSKRALPSLSTRLVEGLKALVFAIVPNTLIVRVQNALDAGAKEKPSTGGR